MERLTYEIIDGGMVTDKENIKEFEIEDGFMVCGGNAIFRLSAYEDTGLTPEQIRELKKRDTGVKPMFSDGWDMCGNCGEHLMPDDNFCSECGQKIKWEE